MAYGKERVLVLPRELALPDGGWQGIDSSHTVELVNKVSKGKEFRPRNEVEENPSFKQIIPYIVFKHEDGYLLMQRTDAGREHRLHNNYSIGIGGHIREEDLGSGDVLDWAQREFHEEVQFEGSIQASVLGVLNDDSNPVGEVHLGVIILVEGDSPEIRVKGEHKFGRLLRLEEMEEFYPEMENWSQVVFDYLQENREQE